MNGEEQQEALSGQSQSGKWHASLLHSTYFSRVLAAVFFVMLLVVGFWLGVVEWETNGDTVDGAPAAKDSTGQELTETSMPVIVSDTENLTESNYASSEFYGNVYAIGIHTKDNQRLEAYDDDTGTHTGYMKFPDESPMSGYYYLEEGIPNSSFSRSGDKLELIFSTRYDAPRNYRVHVQGLEYGFAWLGVFLDKQQLTESSQDGRTTFSEQRVDVSRINYPTSPYAKAQFEVVTQSERGENSPSNNNLDVRKIAYDIDGDGTTDIMLSHNGVSKNDALFIVSGMINHETELTASERTTLNSIIEEVRSNTFNIYDFKTTHGTESLEGIDERPYVLLLQMVIIIGTVWDETDLYL